MNYFFRCLKRDLVIAYRHRIECLNPSVFFCLMALLFPLAITSDPSKLALIGPGVIWIALLLANMISLDNMFTPDFEDGTLEQAYLSPKSFTIFIYAKLASQWLITALPLLVITPFIAMTFFISKQSIIILFSSLLLGSSVFTLIGSIGAALVLGLRNRGILLLLMIVPLYIPVLIFGAGAVNAASLHQPVTSQLLFLCAILSFAFTFVPIAVRAAIKISLD